MIRLADEGDTTPIREIVQRSWIETYSASLGSDTVREHVADEEFYSPEDLRSRMQNENGVVLVAEENTIVGYAFLSWDSEIEYLDADEADLRHIYLDPDHSGQGWGSRLLAAGIEQLPKRTRRLKVLFHPKNDGARAFYEAKGFRRVGLLDLDPSEVGMPSSNVDPPEMYVRDL